MSATLEVRPLSQTPSSGAGLMAPSWLRRAIDRSATLLVTLAMAVAIVPLGWILWTVVSRGGHLLLESQWWTESQRGITSRRAGGGAYHAVVGTLLQAAVTAAISVPLGLLTAVYLVEYAHGRLARCVSFAVDVLTGIPSIVSALFIYSVWVSTLHLQRVAFAVSLALVLLMVPVVVRSSEQMLRLVPNEVREAAYALGVPKWLTIARVVIPTAFSGIVTGVLLGLARVMGETAPLLILAPYANDTNTDLFGGFMAALPSMVNANRVESSAAAVDRTWAAALTLILLVLALNLLARLLPRLRSLKK